MTNEDVELARQSGYNEACYIFEEKVEKLKEEIKMYKKLTPKRALQKIDKIMGEENVDKR